MKKLRIISQTLFFLAFIASFFFLNRQPVAYTWPAEWFLWLNPLTGLVTMIASRSLIAPVLIAGALVFAATIVFGRIFCGFACPLGALIDLSDRYLFRKMVARDRRPPRYLQRLKYVLLFATIVLAVFGAVAPLVMDPVSILTRIAAIVWNPLIRLIASEGKTLLHPLLPLVGMESFRYKVIAVPLFYAALPAAALFCVILAGGFWDRRFWCQYVCPSGAFFGLTGSFAFWRRSVNAGACNSCRRCARVCPTRSIDENTVSRTALSECVVCGDCVALRECCSTFSFARPAGTDTAAADVRRRHVLAGLAGGLALLPALRANAMFKRDNTGRLIRPPGAIPEGTFLGRCLGCGECMKACPTNTIQPCATDDGMHRIFTPKVVPRIAGCEEKCHLCGFVCPTGAIQPLTHDEKVFVKIGTAVIDRHRCLAWSQNKECVVCDEVCPYNAIEAHIVETTKGRFKVPVVYEDLCMGCGMCEQHCPIIDYAAIVIYRFGENRRMKGPFMTVEQKAKMAERRKKTDAHLSRIIGGDQGGNTTGAQSVVDHDPAAPGLPPGFAE